MAADRRTGIFKAMRGWATAGVLAGAVLGLVDLALLWRHWRTPLYTAADVLALGLQVTALLTLAGALVGLVLVPVGVAASRPARRLARWRRLLALVPALAAAGIIVVNATFYVGLYARYHAALAGLTLAGATLAARLVWTQTGVSRRAFRIGAAVTMLVWVQGLVVLPGLSGQGVRLLVHTQALHAAPVARAVTALSDFDGDGMSGLLAAGDCDGFDASVHPGAPDVPGDGIDQDCLAGDASAEAAAALRAARRANAALPESLTPAARPILFITVDALRADHAASLAAFERLRALGTELVRTYAPYPSTILSFYSVLTGRSPAAVKTERVVKWEVPVADESQTLPEALALAGYRTEGLFFHHIFAAEYGITRGFDSVWTASPEPEVVVWGRSADQTADRAIAALERLDRPGNRFFLWVHFYDPHEPYIEHPEFPVDDFSSYEALYAGELRFTDRHLTRLVEAVEARGLFERALVVFTADHGESLGEQGVHFHASNLREEQLRVPLLLAGPGIAAGQRVDVPVSLQDLADTVCALSGLPAPADSQGASFAGLLGGSSPAATVPVFADVYPDSGPQRAVIEWPWKLIHHPRVNGFELFHLEKDPGERLNVYDLVPAEAARLEALLGAWATVVRD